MPEGIIYITRTEQDHPHYYKVGRTNQSTAQQRTRHEQTYISGGIKTMREFQVSDDVQAEKAAHLALADVKVNLPHAKEIFNLDIDFLIARVKSAIKTFLIGEVQNNFQNNWILNFLSQSDFSIANYHHQDLGANQTINLIIDLMMRVIAEPRGASASIRLVEDKPYKELINDSTIGINLEASLKNIDHLSLVNINNWHKKFEVILYLSKAPLINPISRNIYHRALNERNTYNLKSGLKDFNINKVINYWSENYFSSNPKLILGCLNFLDHEVPKWNSHEQQFEDIFLRGAKNSVYINAMKYCVNHPDRNSNEVCNITNQKIWNNHGLNWIYDNLGKKLSSEFDNVRTIIQADVKKYRDSLFTKAKEKKLPLELCFRVELEDLSLDEAIEIHKKVSQIKWLKNTKIGGNFVIEDSETIISLSDIYNGNLDFDEALNKNEDLQNKRNHKIKNEKEFKEQLVTIKDRFKLDSGIDVENTLKVIQNNLFKIFRLLRKRDPLLINEINTSSKVHEHIERLIKMVEGGGMNPNNIKATKGLHFVDSKIYGFPYLTQGNLILSFSSQDQYILWKNNFF